MVFAQLTYRESLRDIEATLGSVLTLPHGNSRPRGPQLFGPYQRESGLAHLCRFRSSLDQEARTLYAGEPCRGTGKNGLRARSTTIDLCLSCSLGPASANAKEPSNCILCSTYVANPHLCRGHRGAGSRRQYPRLSAGPTRLHLHPGSRLSRFRTSLSAAPEFRFLHIRAHQRLNFRRLYSHRVDKSIGLRSDQTGVLSGRYTANKYPDKLPVRYYDAETQKHLVFLSNNFSLTALTVAQLYRCRWRVELFFKWIKQHLRIKAFYGTSPNAVKTQIWIAIPCISSLPS